MSTKVITGKVRASFVHVFEPAAINGGEPKYSCSLIIPKSDTVTIGKIREAIEQAKQEGVPKWGGKIPPNLKLPLRDGDVDRPDDPAGTSRTVSFDYKLRAKLAAETPKEKAFLEATEAAGLHLSDVQRSSMRYVIAAKATAQRIFDNYGADLYTDMLRLIVETWDAVEWSLSKPVLNGCAVFLNVYGNEYKRDRFIRKLAYTNADELAAIARRQNVKDQPRQYAMAILELYNKGGRGRLDESLMQK